MVRLGHDDGRSIIEVDDQAAVKGSCCCESKLINTKVRRGQVPGGWELWTRFI